MISLAAAGPRRRNGLAAPGARRPSPGAKEQHTEFFADPAEDLAAMLFTQLNPYGALPLQRELAQLVYPAVTGRPHTPVA